MSVNAFIIDDERKAISVLKTKLERLAPEIKITGDFQRPTLALEELKVNSPDLVFLDVTMPEMTGIELLRKIQSPDFEVIFVTAYNDYAIEAIQLCAIGYIVKPIINEQLELALQNAKKNIELKTGLVKNTQLLRNLNQSNNKDKKVAIPSSNGLDFIPIQDIIFCEGAQGYTILNLKDKSQIVSSYSIGHFKKMLDNYNFYLVHKSYLINLDHIKSYDRSGIIETSTKQFIPVSRNKRESFLQYVSSC